ncbi:MAG TPA: NAD-dependent epimerase/dehydratase family protein, partial [Thermoanaerobaculia bacterium]|nr:NAD-dependent epimerase/dehydratase family protein [Thermoanaerobaculia bacterium]
VWGLRRDPTGLPAQIQPLAADLADPSSLAVLPEGLEAIAYTAAAGASTEPAYQAAYVQGLANLLEALAARGEQIRRVLFTSSTAVYGQSAGEWVDETSPTEPAGFSGRILLEAERVLARGPFPGIAVRLGGIYGPGRTRLLRQVLASEARLPAEPAYTNRIHRDDCAGLLAHLLALAEPQLLYLGVDHDPADLRDVYLWLAEQLGSPPPQAAEPGASATGARTRAGSKRCSNARLLASGYRFLYPTFREGYGELIEQEARGENC